LQEFREAGRGTIAKIMSEKFGLAHISTGDLFRNIKNQKVFECPENPNEHKDFLGVKGELKSEIDEYMKSGKLASNELTVKILKERMKEPDCAKGIILDGFPRTIEQANELDKI